MISLKFVLIFLYRLVKRILHTILVVLPLYLVGILVMLPFCALYDIGKMPRIVRWFDSADPYIGRNTEVIDKISAGEYTKYSLFSIPESRIQLTLNKYVWLVFRNPLNYFGYVISGLHWVPPIQYTIYDPSEADIGDSGGKRPGFRYIEVEVAGKTYYEYYLIYAFSPAKCFRMRLGWKISDNNNPIGTISQDVFVIQPIKSYRGV